MQIFSEDNFINGALAPIADALAGTVDSDYVNLEKYRRCTFIVVRGVATGGTADHTFTILASSDNAGTGAEAIAFRSREGILEGSALGALTDRLAAGYTNVAGSARLDVIEVDAAQCPDGKPFVNLHSVEVTNDPVVACIVAIAGKPRYAADVMPDATV